MFLQVILVIQFFLSSRDFVQILLVQLSAWSAPSQPTAVFVAEITQTQRKSETIGKFRQCILCFLKLLSEIFRACLSPVTEEFSFRKTLTGLTTNLKDIPLWPLTHLNEFARGGYSNSSILVARESFTLLDTIVSIEDTLKNPFSSVQCKHLDFLFV